MSRDTKRKRPTGTSTPSKRTKSAVSDPATTVVRGEALSWKQVVLPDRLEDAEGFYDLEEIEDVEVVRDERNHIMFVPKNGQVVDDGSPQTLDGAAGEWNGFQDEAIVSNQLVPQAAPKPKTCNLKNKKNGRSTQDDEVLSNMPYNLLSVSGKEVDVSAWADLTLSQNVLSAISHLGFTKPTPIQLAAIQHIIDGKDLIGKAVTGSGKTLAFAIPIVERFLGQETASTIPIALILAPTRELAYQLERHIKDLCQTFENPPRVIRVTGGLSILKQQRQLENADVIIATPGRLWEVMNDSHGLIDRLRKIQFLVIDEADRLLSEGHFKEVEDILELLDQQDVNADEPRENPMNSSRQTLVFSATFYKNLHQKLAGKMKSSNNVLSNQQSLAYLLEKLQFQSKPKFIDANPTSNMAAQLDESIVECGAMEKDLYLYATLLQYPRLKTLVFTNSISSVKRITPILQSLSQGALALHSSMPQKSRLRSLERFTASTTQNRGILVATDVAARGLDITDVDLIIHYHVPHAADMYVHRSGRTARADKSGRSILLCSPEELIPTTRLISKVHGEGRSPSVVSVNRQIVTRIKPRMTLAQKIVETEQAKDKTGSKDNWLRNAAEELGVDYDSEDFEDEGRRQMRGRGGGKGKYLKEKAATGKYQVRAWREELRVLLSQKVNLGVNAKYLAGGAVNVDSILDGKGDGIFLESR